MQLPKPIWFLGCGNMAGAMVEGWRSAGIDLSSAVAIRPSGKEVEGVRTVTSVKQAGAAPAMVILGFKPQQIDDVAPDLLPWITSKTIIVSILAGVEAQSLRQRFKKGVIVRAMPNLPVSVRRGVTALYSEDSGDEVRTLVGDAFGALGYAIWTETEQAFGAIGTVAGAGPAYVARFVDALAQAGIGLGLSKPTATTIALETMLGTAWMAAARGETMDELAGRVASPRGTTEAGLAVLDRDDALVELIRRTIHASRRRSAELAAQARGEQVA
ncbi:MAG TPA: pyrroline-5-carboxylate reductase [Sphingomicrobium sp.]|nr:pyrroline-5-carboxylate reductase [Sphingomicrobium sp.]